MKLPKIDKIVLMKAIGIMMLSWAALPLVYVLLIKRKREEKEEKEEDDKNNRAE